MHIIDQELSGINQLGAIVGAISGYLCGKQFGQLCLTADWQTIWSKKNGLQVGDMAAVHENEEKKNPTLHLMLYPPQYAAWEYHFHTIAVTF